MPLNGGISMDIENLKPKAKHLKDISEIILTKNILCQAKADGEFTIFFYNRKGRSYTINNFNNEREGNSFPALEEMIKSLDKQIHINTLVLLCEVYCINEENQKMLLLPQLIHNLRNSNGDKNSIRIGIFDLKQINGTDIENEYLWKYEEMHDWFQNCQRVSILPYIVTNSNEDIKKFWNHWVNEMNYEGIFIKNDELVKIKKNMSIDCAVVGLNKTKLFNEKKIASIKVAVMNQENQFIELGDVSSGINRSLRESLYKLMEFKIYEDKTTVWIKPLVVVEVGFNDIYYDRNKILFSINNNEFKNNGFTEFISIRSPRLIRFRKDKKITYSDIRKEQI